MASVTQMVKAVSKEQPYGGFFENKTILLLKPKYGMLLLYKGGYP